jgi:SAM-dependent methyltransferase
VAALFARVAANGLDSQREYWNSAGTTKTFGHPIELTWLDGLDRHARVLDYGCGYGRLVGLLAGHGFDAVEGVDVAENMIERARAGQPGGRFAVLRDPPRLPYGQDTFDAVMLFAVLTCVPSDEGQRGLVAELHRVLRRGGLLYLSDLCLQGDQRNRFRYQRFAARYGTYGVFETDDGAVCRHHTTDWLRDLFTDFDIARTRDVDVDTMNGRPIRATQLLMTKR